MKSPQHLPAGYREQATPRVILRYQPNVLTGERAAGLVGQADQIVRYVERRLAPLIEETHSRDPLILTLVADRTPPFDEPDQIALGPDGPAEDFGARVALLTLERRVGGPALWRGRGAVELSTAGRHGLTFVSLGLARYLAAQARGDDRGRLFELSADGRAPRESADQVCRQVAADRQGKLPLYESFMRGSGQIAIVPEYVALAEAFCGYLFEREGPKAYLRLLRGVGGDPNEILDLIYGKSFEELQDEWMGALLRGQGRQPVSLKQFAVQIVPYLRPYGWLVSVALALIFFSAGVAQVAPFVFRDIIDIVTAVAGKGNPDLFVDGFNLVVGGLIGPGQDLVAFNAKHGPVLDALGRLYSKIGILLTAAFVNLCTLVWLIYTVNVVSNNIIRDLRIQLTERLHHLSATFYARQRLGDMTSRFISDVARMGDPLAEVTAYSVYHIASMVATVIAMLTMSWQLSLVLFLIVPAYYVVNRRFGPTIQAASRTRQERLGQLNANFVEMLYGQSLIKSYGLAHHILNRFKPKVGEMRKVAIWADFLKSIYTEVIGIVENIQVKLVLAAGGTLAIFGQISVGTIVGFNLQASRFITPLHKLGIIYSNIAICAASLRRIEEVLREPIELMETPPGGSYAPDSVGDGITFDRVSFSYTSTEPTLIDINLHIPAGQKIAFVGPTGAGKSTLANLLPRFYDVESGAVRINGRDIREFSLRGLRESISIVSQDTFLFNSTILENIRFGRLDASDEEVFEAARRAKLHSFVEGLPAGYDTIVGERGGRLSGGQRQRVAIARALLRNSPILILDEATSALDAETESEILQELEDVTRGKTVISITHRLGLAIQSDLICVLQAGRIIQQGTHEELIRQDGLYHKLFEDQNHELIRRGIGQQLDETVDRITAVPTFSVVPGYRVADLGDGLTSEQYDIGDLLTCPDDQPSRLYVLRVGTVEVTLQDGSAEAQRLAIGAPIGLNGHAEMVLLLSVPRSVTVRALSPIEVDVLGQSALPRLLGTSNPLDGHGGSAAMLERSPGVI